MSTEEEIKYQKQLKKSAHKKQLREARRKLGNKKGNRKPRKKDWDANGWNEDDYQTRERILPRGKHERRKERENIALGTERSSIELDPVMETSATQTGLVVEVSSGLCRVEIGDETLLCTVRGNLKEHDTGYSNVVAVGDNVEISRDGDERGVVESIHPRHSVLARAHGTVLSLQQIVVANVDQVLIVASWREPHIWFKLIDRYLIAAQRNDLKAIICVNKTDLIKDQKAFHEEIQPYKALGYELILASALSGDGIEELGNLLKGGTTVLAGLSGVGKSSLLSAVEPDLNLRTGSVAEAGLFRGQGRHTTTQSSLWKLADGGIVIDTPGIRDFGLAGIKQAELSNWYPEMKLLAGNCRYADCSHINETECAIKAAVESGDIAPVRYKNFVGIRETLPA
jgi:ribosome biogenesis GTPase